MSFLPVIAIATIAKDNSYAILQDVTGTYPTSSTGYGTSNGPASQAAITRLWAQVSLYNDAVPSSASVNGALGDDITITGPLKDGVNIISLFYGEYRNSVSYEISDDFKRLTVSAGGLVALLEGVWGISLDPEQFPNQIKAISDTTVDFYSPFPDDTVDSTGIYRVYKADAKALIMNNARSKETCMVLALPMEGNDCTDLFEVMELESIILVAQKEFKRGNYARANEAIRLATGNTSLQTCTDCV